MTYHAGHPYPCPPPSPPRSPCHLTNTDLCDQLRRLHKRGYSDAQIARWFESERSLLFTLRQVWYWRRVFCDLPSNGQHPRFDGNDIKTRREQNDINRRKIVAYLGWGHLLSDPPDYIPDPDELPRPIVFDLKPVEAAILSLLKEHRRMTRRDIVVALGKHRSRNPLYSDGTNYLRRLVEAGLLIEHRETWCKRAIKAYTLADGLPMHTRTKRDDTIDKLMKKLNLSLYD